eukprot:TRINITY_DN22693_c1_g3_i3.p1 TRINITY_DN22693_c1_g3~~TRINITY_DN22693_c1_g3_i3.p1  ORF type:complete len:104 (-),score=13.34 TRINITY_DN22693_c1_g3_i3:174-485(-)
MSQAATHSHVNKQLYTAPKAIDVGAAACHEEGGASCHENRKALQIAQDISLVDADFVEPEARRPPMRKAKRFAPLRQRLPLLLSIVMPAVGEKGVACRKPAWL